MTPTQEGCNALSMLLPCMFIGHSYWASPDPHVAVILCGGLIHLPAVIAYHMRAALGRLDDVIDNDLRRLDQTYAHIVASVYSYALSGSAEYAVFNGLVNAYFISQVWRSSTSNDGKRWTSLLMSVGLYTAPMIYRKDIENYTRAVASVVIGGALFVPCVNYKMLGGWGHCLFHVMMIMHGLALSESARMMH